MGVTYEESMVEAYMAGVRRSVREGDRPSAERQLVELGQFLERNPEYQP